MLPRSRSESSCTIWAKDWQIGSAFATGSVALGSFLVLGFTLHNLSEGIGIVAPMVKQRPSFWVFAAVAGLAGSPAVAGVWIGSYALSPIGRHSHLRSAPVLFFRSLPRLVRYWFAMHREKDWRGSRHRFVWSGAGAAAMYATVLLVQV